MNWVEGFMKKIELDLDLVIKIKNELYSSYEQLLDVEENEWASEVEKLIEILNKKLAKAELE